MCLNTLLAMIAVSAGGALGRSSVADETCAMPQGRAYSSRGVWQSLQILEYTRRKGSVAQIGSGESEWLARKHKQGPITHFPFPQL